MVNELCTIHGPWRFTKYMGIRLEQFLHNNRSKISTSLPPTGVQYIYYVSTPLLSLSQDRLLFPVHTKIVCVEAQYIVSTTHCLDMDPGSGIKSCQRWSKSILNWYAWLFSPQKNQQVGFVLKIPLSFSSNYKRGCIDSTTDLRYSNFYLTIHTFDYPHTHV